MKKKFDNKEESMNLVNQTFRRFFTKNYLTLKKCSAVILVLGLIINCGSSALGVGVDIVINNDGTVIPNNYSNTAYVGVDGKSSSLGDNVNSIKTQNGGTNNSVYGIKASGSTSITATAMSGGIDVKAAIGNAEGIHLEGTGTSQIYNISSIKTSAESVSQDSIGIYTNGSNASFSANISFNSNGEQAITATAKSSSSSIYTIGSGATTVSFTNSILSGEVYQSGSSTLTLNFNDGGKWTPVASDVKGNVNVNLNSGSAIDTRATETASKTINLGSGIFIGASGSKISFDAITAPNGLTTDQIKAANAIGEIMLGSVNVKDTAISVWSTAKKAEIFATTTAATIEIKGETYTLTDKGHLYTFKGDGTNGKVSVTSVEYVPYTLSQIIQANPQEAGEIDTYSFTGDVTLTEDLGTLNNTYRTSGNPEFTINGNNHTLSADVYKGVTINEGDTLFVKNVTISGFDTFATNNGALDFTDVTLTGAVLGAGTTIINGTVTSNSLIVNNIALNNTTDTLIISANNIGGTVTNVGTLNLGAGTLGKVVSGDGTIVTTGNVTTDANNLRNIVTNDTGNNLILTAGTVEKAISGTGTTTIFGTVTNNSTINQTTINVNSSLTNNEGSTSAITATNFNIDNNAVLNLKDNNITATNFTVNNATINFANTLHKTYSFGALTLNGRMNLSINADLDTKNIDKISATSVSGDGDIYVGTINILADTQNKSETLNFADSVLKGKIDTRKDAASDRFIYDVAYDKLTGGITFVKKDKDNPVNKESSVNSLVNGYVAQTVVAGQVFANVDSQVAKIKQANSRQVLYASTSNQIFESGNSIERALWLRPFVSNERIDVGTNVDSTLYGTLAGIDLPVSEDKMVSVYLGYSGAKQEYDGVNEKIKANNNTYILGVSGTLAKKDYFVSVTVNAASNKTNIDDEFGSYDNDVISYSAGVKGAYDFDLGKNWILQPSLMLMYVGVGSNNYTNTQSNKVEQEAFNGLLIEPQIKAKLSLDKGWAPYGLVAMDINEGETKAKVNGLETKSVKLDPSYEYGVGVSKDFVGSAWSCYGQVTGKAGSRQGVGCNLGVKYAF